jgi:hypothetical protein
MFQARNPTLHVFAYFLSIELRDRCDLQLLDSRMKYQLKRVLTAITPRPLLLAHGL